MVVVVVGDVGCSNEFWYIVMGFFWKEVGNCVEVLVVGLFNCCIDLYGLIIVGCKYE